MTTELTRVGNLADVYANLLLALLDEGPPGTADRLKESLRPVARVIQARAEAETAVLHAAEIVVNEDQPTPLSEVEPSLAERIFGLRQEERR